MEIRNLIIALIVGPLLTDIDADINISQYKWGFYFIVLFLNLVGWGYAILGHSSIQIPAFVYFDALRNVLQANDCWCSVWLISVQV